jgi:hypothetical protein
MQGSRKSEKKKISYIEEIRFENLFLKIMPKTFFVDVSVIRKLREKAIIVTI